ncbi:MAG: nucleotidyltransferase substrate binding protein [bacterium]
MRRKSEEVDMTLIIENLEKALASLEKVMELSDSPAAKDPEMLRALYDSVIQRFEYTYEFAFKLLRRQLKTMSATPQEFDTMSFRDVIRRGGEAGLVLNVEFYGAMWKSRPTYLDFLIGQQ